MEKRKVKNRSVNFEKGTKIGYLEIIDTIYLDKYRGKYRCKCICGKTRDVIYSYLIKNPNISCGCMNFSSNNHGNRKYSPEDSSFRAKANSYKSLAKNRKIDFLLSVEETINLLKGDCKYCGKKPSNYFNYRKNSSSSKKTNYSSNHPKDYQILYNGIDRVDNKKGYTKENTVTCCTQCNTAKLNFTLDEFKSWIESVYNKIIKV
jgi:hypothetical protein